MEILATGEKIKRARIYKGLTLKELCEERLSVSKLSCIENDKIQAEPETLQYISEKLDINYSYLTEGIRIQIENNIKTLIKDDNIKDYEEVLEYNLKYAVENEYYDLAFQLMHLLLMYYLEHEENQKVQAITSKYYDLCIKSCIEENYIMYNLDMGKYFYVNKEYYQAISCYSSVRKQLMDSKSAASEKLASVIYDEVTCYMALKNYNDALKLAEQLEGLTEIVDDGIKKGRMYHILAVLFLRVDEKKFKLYESKTYNCYEGSTVNKCWAIFDIACGLFELGVKETAMKYIEQGLELYPKNDEPGWVTYMISCIGALVDSNYLNVAQGICDETLNVAIMLDNIRFIEKAYYYKAIILQKQGNYISAEMYMNLSTDALFKCGSKQERYKRYIEMGNMYHKLGQVNDAIKYLSLAMHLEKKL